MQMFQNYEQFTQVQCKKGKKRKKLCVAKCQNKDGKCVAEKLKNLVQIGQVINEANKNLVQLEFGLVQDL